MVDGKFPGLSEGHPEQLQANASRLTASVLQQALQRAAILSNEKFRGVRWVLTSGSLRIICTNSDQEEAEEELEVDYSGEALDIGFNVSYLLDVLTNVDSQEVECSLGDSNSSMLITMPGRRGFQVRRHADAHLG